jgi:predicted O-methyltransferase YrrM
MVNRVVAFLTRFMYAGLSCVYLFTIGFLSTRNRSLISTICAHFGYSGKLGKNFIKQIVPEMIPKIELSELIQDKGSVQLQEPLSMEGELSLLELVVVNSLVRDHNPSKLFEFGTFNGRTTLNMATNSSQEATVYTLDLSEDQMGHTEFPLDPNVRSIMGKQMVGSRYSGTDCENKIVQLYGDSATFDFSPFFNVTDFVFIDGAHSYQYVLNDSRKAIKLLNDGRGVILWHNYGQSWEGVLTALNKLYSEDNRFKDLKHVEGTALVCLIAK